MEIVREVRQAMRRLRQRPGFTVVAAATLALGIGANTAIFSVVHPVLVRPLPYERPERLVWISEVAPSPGIELTSAADYRVARLGALARGDRRLRPRRPPDAHRPRQPRAARGVARLGELPLDPGRRAGAGARLPRRGGAGGRTAGGAGERGAL
jgi:hypothetical protein